MQVGQWDKVKSLDVGRGLSRGGRRRQRFLKIFIIAYCLLLSLWDWKFHTFCQNGINLQIIYMIKMGQIRLNWNIIIPDGMIVERSTSLLTPFIHIHIYSAECNVLVATQVNTVPGEILNTSGI